MDDSGLYLKDEEELATELEALSLEEQQLGKRARIAELRAEISPKQASVEQLKVKAEEIPLAPPETEPETRAPIEKVADLRKMVQDAMVETAGQLAAGTAAYATEIVA